MSLLFYDKYTDSFLIGVGVDLYQYSSHNSIKHITKCGQVPTTTRVEEVATTTRTEGVATTTRTEEVAMTTRAEGVAHITGVASSERHVAVISNNKVVELYSREFERQALTVATKRPTSVQLTERNVVISDKAGDAYSYDLRLTNQKYLLGHVSVVMDTLVTRDERYLITCDRDEKIRVSHYPNCYNVASYLLGHTEYVYRILQLSSNLLLSLGGDGEMIMWDLETQSELQRISSTHGDYTSVAFTSPSVQRGPDTSPYLVTGTTRHITLYTLSENKLTQTSELTVEDDVVSLAASRSSVMLFTRGGRLLLYTLLDGVLSDRREISGDLSRDIVCCELPEKKKVVRTAGFTEYFERKRKRIEEETLKEEMKQVRAS